MPFENPKRTIKLDQDSGMRHITIKAIRAVLRVLGIGLVRAKRYSSQSGTGYHWYIEVDRDLPPLAIVAIQACMGSDLKRETLNLSRILGPGFCEDLDWNMLFDAKYCVEEGRKNAKKKARRKTGG